MYRSHSPRGPPMPPQGPTSATSMSTMGPPGRVPHIPNSAANYNNTSNSNAIQYPGQPSSGPTPTLNQLLQSPNPLQRYQHHNNYNDYAAGGPPQTPKEHNIAQQQQQMYRNQHYGSLNNAMMPPPSCYPSNTMPSTTPASAAAAAAQAVMAAANTANTRSPHSAMYLRQHLQQKMYPNSGQFGPLGPPGMSMGPSMMHSGGPPMHGMPPNEQMPPNAGEANANSYMLGPPPHMPPQHNSDSSGAATSVTQTITSPLSAAPSMTNSIAEVRTGPQPPPILDEASQASTCSSQADDSCDTPKPSSKMPGLSHPSTPNTLGSPGAASMSSFHDEFESVSSPSWPRTPASPVINSQVYEHGHNIKRPDGLMKLYDMSDEPERKAFLDKLIQFLEERGTPISQCPTISKLPLDLFKIYIAVKERGGFVEVTRAKLWKECTQICNIATSSSAAYTLRKQYIKHLLPFECKFDRGGVDPQPIIASLESANRKNKKNAVAVPPPESPYQSHAASQNMDGYTSSSYASQPFPPPPPMSNSHYPPQPSGPPQHPNAPPCPPPQSQAAPPPANSMNSMPPSGMSAPACPPQTGPPTLQPSHQPYPHQSATPGQMSVPPSHASAPNTTTSLPNHNESVSVQDPFADDVQHSAAYHSRTQPPQPAVPPHSAPNAAPQSNYYSNYNYSNMASHNAYYNSMPPQTPHPNMPPLQEHYGYYNNDAYARQNGQSDPYSMSSGVYSQNSRMAPPSYYNQQQGYDHRNDVRFEHTRPPSQDNVYGAQQSMPPHQTRAPYPMGPAGQPVAPHQSNQPPTSNSNYVRSGSSPIGQYGSMAQQMPYSSTNHDAYKQNNDINNYQNAMLRMQSPLARALSGKISQSSQNYSGSQPMYTGSSTPQGMAGMPQKSGPSPPHSQSGVQTSATTWHPANAQFNQKRHPDFMKQEGHYPPVNNSYGTSQGSMPSTQYPPYSNANSNRQTPPSSSSSQPMWSRDAQFRGYGPPTNSHMPPNVAPTPPFGAPSGAQKMAQSRDGWDHMTGPRVDGSANCQQNRYSPSQTGPQSHELYSGPTPYGGSHQINKMANFAPRTDQNRMYPPMPSSFPPPNKVPIQMMGPNSGAISQPMHSQPYPHPQQTHHHLAFQSMKKEIIFPADSVESAQPMMSKRRKLMARDVNQVEAWRLFMCLKSGLLAESTWALDMLSVLLYDDSSVLYFGLQHMPGMLEVLLEHYKRYLSEIFDGLFDDTEIGFEANHSIKDKIESKVKKEKMWYELDRDLSEEFSDDENIKENISEEIDSKCSTPKKMFAHNIPHFSEQLVLLNSVNFTHKSRDGKPIKLSDDKSLFIVDPNKNWDCFRNGFNSGSDHWTLGFGESTNHIQTHFESKQNYVRFVKLIKNKRKRKQSNGNNDNIEKAIEVKIENDKNEKPVANASLEKLPAIKNKCVINCKKEPNFVIGSDVCVKIEKKDSTDVTDSNNNSNNNNSSNNNNNNNSDKDSTKSDETPNSYLKVRDSDLDRYMKRKKSDDLEEESYDQDEPAVQVGEDFQDSLSRRCLCLSTLIRNLSFVPGNDADMSKHSGLLLVMSRLLLLHHSHLSKKRNFEKSLDDELFAVTEVNECIATKEWWWDMLHLIRENTLVTIANMSGQLDLSPYSEQISLPFLDGLLHWAVCPSSYAQDSLPSSSCFLSPQKLAFEALSKLSILDANVDLILATPPWHRIDKLYHNLSRSLSRHEDQTVREFSVVLLSNLSSADSSSARAIALTGCAIPLLISFVEQAEQSALQVANAQGINALRENPELMGTTLDMVRRSASTLRCLSHVPDNRPLFLQYQQRLLALVMSQILDQGVAAIIADVIYECSLAANLSDYSDIDNNSSNNNNKTNNEVNSSAANEVKPEAEVNNTDLDNDSNDYDDNDSNSANTT